jgi:cytidylate kinase
MIITLDGPSASGKSRAARALAHVLSIYYLSTGYLYRAVAYSALKRGIVITEKQQLEDTLITECADPRRLFYRYEQGNARVFFDDVDITGYLKNPVVDRSASIVSAQPAVRAALISFQRALAESVDLVADGRDCGSVVFPTAAYKFFITASLDERARRWAADCAARGIACSLQEARAALIERDTRDAARAVSPLIIPEGALVIDTTTLPPDAVVAQILAHIHE